MILFVPTDGKSNKTEPGEVTSPPHSSSKKDDMKRDRDNQDMNDSEEEEDEDEGDLLEEDEVRL